MNKKILAKVDGNEITQEMFDSIVRNLPEEHAAHAATEEGQKRLLDEIISGELLYIDAMAKKMDEEESFKSILEEAKKNMLQRYAIEGLIMDVDISDDDALAYFNANTSQYAKNEEVTASHILVTTKEESERIAEEINEGLEFAEAAKKYSSCPSKEVGGNLGTFEKGRMVPEFEKAVFSLPVGVVSEPVETQFGFHLIKVEGKNKPGVAEFGEVKDSIKAQMLNQMHFDLYTNKINDLKNQHTVELF
ncbi:MAG: Peptidyl-prolyl cis-trans isomerase, EpsD family [Clostridiales bacterium 38_11]|nr:MAG: Peptidyl-prolyl cis-trans isomerase, EpsD family [Clostridiales bacterium 38_11]